MRQEFRAAITAPSKWIKNSWGLVRATLLLDQAMSGSDPSVITMAVTRWRQVLTATPADHPQRARYLSNLGIALQLRFERVGEGADLDEAIKVGQAAVEAAPTDHPERWMYLSNLGGALRDRFERAGVLADLDAAIRVGQAAVEATPTDHPYRARYLSNLGISLRDRFELVGERVDLDEAVRVGRAAVEAIPTDHPNLAPVLSNLGIALQVRFERVGERVDLDEAIRVGRAVVHATPTDHPTRADRLSNLGVALRIRFERMGAQTDLDEAIRAYVQALEVESAATSVRIRAARTAAALSAHADATSAADLLDRAVRLLPLTVPRQLHRSDQHYALGRFTGLTSDATALALRAGAPGPSGEKPAIRALRLLELGRGVLLTQALDTRGDLTDLQAHHPGLAARFRELRDQLDKPVDTSASAHDTTTGWAQRQIEDRHRLAAAFEATVADIRQQSGFRTFLLPPEPDQLLRHAQHGPIVLINVSQYRSDVLLLTPTGITTIPLPNLTQDTLINKIDAFGQALDTAYAPEASPSQWEEAEDTLSAILEWLWDAAAGPILDELGYHRTPTSGTPWPRLWWVPGGLLGLLPLHAAGYHRAPPGPDGDRRTVLDRVISSYTPTVRALGYARERNAAPTDGERALIVAMPTTPGHGPLPHATEEAEVVRRRLPESILLVEDPATTDSRLPTRANVRTHLAGCGIVHFACHGCTNPGDPAQSLLLLHDHETHPLNIASLASIRLDQARLAYLSACRTAFNPATDLIDEAIHLATAFQLVGYPNVIGTLWKIDDVLSVRVADTFYTALTSDDTTIDTTTARALHDAVRALRDEQPAAPFLWAAYLHAGA